MTRTLFFILFLFLSLLNLPGCRASKELKARNERTSTEETGVELRKVDSLWSSLAEKFNCKIEFYPLEYSIGNGTPTAFTGASLPADPCSTVPAGVANPLPWQAQGVGAGGMGAALRQAHGAVKSIEFTMERDAQTAATNQMDSAYYNNSAAEETLQEEKASEARQDNGTIAIVSVVAAVVILLALLIIIKKTLHK